MKAEYTLLMDMEKIIDYFPEDNGLVRIEMFDEKTGSEKWVFTNDKGEIAGGHEWDWAYGFVDGFARVMNGVNVGMVNDRGEIAVPAVWDAVESVSDGHMVVKLGEKFGAVDVNGCTVVAPKWDELSDCSEGRFIAKLDGEYFILGINGEDPVKVNWECRHISPFQNGVALIMDDEAPCRYGLINLKGGLEHAPMWDTATRMFPGSRRYVKMDGKLYLVRMVDEKEG